MCLYFMILTNGKFSAATLSLDKALKKVLLPTFGSPTIPMRTLLAA